MYHFFMYHVHVSLPIIRVDGEETEECVIGGGVRQVYRLSSTLFNMYAEAMMQEMLEHLNEGIKVNGTFVNKICR